MSPEATSVGPSPERKTSSYFYIFRMPPASLIYPQLTRDETLSLLHDINTSRPDEERLPYELLLRINDEVHASSNPYSNSNSVYEKIRSVWTPILHVDDDEDYSEWQSIQGYRYYGWNELPLARARMDPSKKQFYIPGTREVVIPSDEYTLLKESAGYQKFLEGEDGHASITLFGPHKMIASADLLYRLLCFFPEVYIDKYYRYESAWAASLRHNQTGMGLQFTEYDGRARMTFNWGETLNYDRPFDDLLRRKYDASSPEDKATRDHMTMIGTPFSEDALNLLNALVGASNHDDDACGSRRFPYFHPIANADIPMSTDEHYLIIPQLRERPALRDMDPYTPWMRIQVELSDTLPVANSLLPVLKYNTESREIETECKDKTVALTKVISSSLLSYRLRSCFPYINDGSSEPDHLTEPEPELIHGRPPFGTSLWRIDLVHRASGTRLTFMDYRGLFDIRANTITERGEVEGVAMRDIVVMMNGLCIEDRRDPDGY